MEDVDGVLIDNVRIVNADNGVIIQGTNAANVTARNVVVTNATATAGKLGIKIVVSGLITKCTVDDCAVDGLNDSSAAAVAGVWVESPVGGAVNVTKCNLTNIGSATCSAVYGVRTVGGINGLGVAENRVTSLTSLDNSYGISVEDDGTLGASEIAIDKNNLVSIDGLGAVRGIDVATYVDLSISNNKLHTIGTSSSGGHVTAIRWGWNTAATGAVDQEGATLIGNVINGVESDGTGEAVGLYGAVGVARCTVNGNSITDCTKGAGGGTGIWLDTQSVTGGPAIRDVSVVGNTGRA